MAQITDVQLKPGNTIAALTIKMNDGTTVKQHVPMARIATKDLAVKYLSMLETAKKAPTPVTPTPDLSFLKGLSSL